MNMLKPRFVREDEAGLRFSWGRKSKLLLCLMWLFVIHIFR